MNEFVPSTLVCFPFAGAGASFFHPWKERFSDAVTVLPMQLPGRERLIAEAPFDDLQRAADYLADRLAKQRTGESVTLFGHCFLGAALAFEVARRMESTGEVGLDHLVVSAARSPKRRHQYGVQGLDGGAFVALVTELTGYVHPALEIPEIRELVLMALRADFMMDETYVPSNLTPLEVPITAIYARHDALVDADEVREWAELTAQEFNVVEVAGGHMYVAEDLRELVDTVTQVLRADRKPVAG